MKRIIIAILLFVAASVVTSGAGVSTPLKVLIFDGGSSIGAILMEDGGFLLMEDGGALLLE